MVEAVVDRIEASCIFSDDKQYMRRLAYVESSDGTHPKTYRDGYDGGIWQVGNKFNDGTHPKTYRDGYAGGIWQVGNEYPGHIGTSKAAILHVLCVRLLHVKKISSIM